MAAKKTIKLGIDASFTNLDELKKSLQSLSKMQLSPLDTVDIKKALKSIEEIYKKFPDKKINIGADWQSRELEEFIEKIEKISSTVEKVKFPELDIEKQITSSKEYLSTQAKILEKEEQIRKIKTNLSKDEWKLSDKGKSLVKQQFPIEEWGDKSQLHIEYDKAVDSYRKQLSDLRTEYETLKKSQQDYVKTQKDTQKIGEKVEKLEEQKSKALKSSRYAVKDATGALKNFNEEQKKTEEHQKRLNFANTLKDILGYTAAVNLMRKAYRETINTIKDLDKAFTEMAMVSTLTREEAWWLEKQLFRLADRTGATATEVAQLTTYYLQQGRSLNDALQLTEVAAKSAKVASISTKEAADLLTTAINGFGMAASEAEAVADKFARLAAVSATNFEEMANALSKVASQANMAGMSMDFTLGLLAKGIETTRESPESIGTALKTVIARMQELSDFGKTLEDGMDVNRVETMLSNLGIALRDSNGELRSLEDVIKELGGSWRDLTKNQKAGIAVALAGTRQQSRLIAMMDDFERTLELTNEAQESAGTLNAQHSVYVQGLEASINKLTNSYQEFVSSLADNQLLITLVNILRWVLNTVTKVTNFFGKRFNTILLGTVFAISSVTKVVSGLGDAFNKVGWEGKSFVGKIKAVIDALTWGKADKVKDFGKKIYSSIYTPAGKDPLADIDKQIEETKKKIAEQEKLAKESTGRKAGGHKTQVTKGKKELAELEEKKKKILEEKKVTEDLTKAKKKQKEEEKKLAKENKQALKDKEKERKAAEKDLKKFGKENQWKTLKGDLKKEQKEREQKVKTLREEEKALRDKQKRQQNEIKTNNQAAQAENKDTQAKQQNTQATNQNTQANENNDKEKQDDQQTNQQSTNAIKTNTVAINQNTTATNQNTMANQQNDMEKQDDLGNGVSGATPRAKGQINWGSVGKAVGNIAATAAITWGISKLTKTWQEYGDVVNGVASSDALGKIAENQEKITSLKSLGKELEDLGQIAVKSEDQIARFNEVVDEIKQVAGEAWEGIVKMTYSGEVDTKATEEALNDYIQKEEDKNRKELEKARDKSKVRMWKVGWAWLAGAAIGGGAAWLAGAKIGGTIGSAAGPLGTILGVGAGALLGGAVAGTATLIAEHKEKKWLKNEENQQVLKDLATLDLKEQESYQKLSEEQKMAVNARVAAAKDMYDFTKGSVEWFEKYAAKVGQEIMDIEMADNLSAKFKAYKDSANKKQLKEQYALLDFLDTVKNGEELANNIESLVKSNALTLDMAQGITNTLSSYLKDQYDNDEDRDNAVAELQQEYLEDYQKFIDNFEENAKKGQYLTKDFTGYLNYLTQTGQKNQEEVQKLYDSMANVKTIEQVSQSAKSLLSRAKNFNEIVADLQKGELDSEKLLDLIGTYGLSAEEIGQLVSGNLTSKAEVIAKAYSEASQKLQDEVYQAINDLHRKMQDATEDELKVLQAEEAQYLAIYEIQAAQLKLQLQSNNALSKYKSTLEEVEKLMDLGYTAAELWYSKDGKSGYFKRLEDEFEEAAKESRANIQEIVDWAGGAITFNEQGLAQLDLSGLDGENIAVAKEYYNRVLEIQNDYLADYKAWLQREVDAQNAQLEEQKTILQERLDAYSDYMDEMDRLEGEAETNKSREDIAAQLARLGTATDVESLKKRKELTQQLEELNKTQLQTERELGSKGLEDQISSLDEQMATNTKNMTAALKQAAIDFADGIKAAGSEFLKEALDQSKIKSGTDENNEDSKTATNVETQNNIQTVNVYLGKEESSVFGAAIMQDGNTINYK